MSDVEKYISQRKKTDPEFAEGFEDGYREFEIALPSTSGKKNGLRRLPTPAQAGCRPATAGRRDSDSGESRRRVSIERWRRTLVFLGV
jgi:HTH-type transcriptional regulator / antitoxin HipB